MKTRACFKYGLFDVGLKKGPLTSLDSSSNNQMIVLLIIRNLGRLKKIRPKRPTKIGRNDPGPKRPRAETTQAETTQGRNDSGPKRPGTVCSNDCSK